MEPLSARQRKSLERCARTYHAQLDQSALDYLAERGLSSRSIETHLLGVVRSPLRDDERYIGRLAIPYIGPRGNIYDVRYRCLEDHNHADPENRCPKYLGSDGLTTRIFNTRALMAPTDYIFICEGEIDAITMTECGWPAVAVPGAHAWKRHHARMFGNFGRIVIFADGDEAGAGLAAKISKDLPEAVIVKAYSGGDVNEIYATQGIDGLKRYLTFSEDEGEDDE